MTTLTDRLRSLVILDEVGSNNPLAKEVADEIHRLNNEIARLSNQSMYCPACEAAAREEPVAAMHDLGHLAKWHSHFTAPGYSAWKPLYTRQRAAHLSVPHGICDRTDRGAAEGAKINTPCAPKNLCKCRLR